MGTTDTSILGNDEALDAYYQYFELYNNGKSTSEIEQWFREKNPFLFQNKTVMDASGFWLGLAHAQWETKALSDFVLDRVKEILEQNIEEELWEEAYPERKKELEKFLRKIQKEKKTAKKPIKQKLFKAPFRKGDVLTGPISNISQNLPAEKWGILVCISHSEGLQKSGTCLFLVLDVVSDKPATMEDVSGAFAINIYGASLSSKSKEIGQYENMLKLQKIGKAEIERTFSQNTYGFTSWAVIQGRYDDEQIDRVENLIQKPASPYTEWAERIVFLNSLANEEERMDNKEEFLKVGQFLQEMQNDQPEEFNADFVPFMEKYMILEEIGYTLKGIIHTMDSFSD